MTKCDDCSNPVSGFPGGFTVLMAVYRADDINLFVRAVNSVYENTLQPDAFVLVVDGPVPDGLHREICSLQERYGIEVLPLPKNVGLAKALNAGLETVRTEWVVRADADDYNLPARFSLQADVARRCGGRVDIMGGAIQEVDTSGNALAIRRTAIKHDEIIKYAAYRNPFNHMTIAYKTQLARRCGGYPDIHLKEDYALWAKMLASDSQALNLPDIIVHATAGKDMYRRRGGVRYALAEIALQRLLVSLGLKSHAMALVHGLSRAGVFLLPPTIRGWFYENLLRSRA